MFEGIMSSFEAKRPTGSPSAEDLLCAAIAVYNSNVIVSQMCTYLRDKHKSPGPPFVFQEAFQYLRTTHTWSMVLAAQEAAIVNAESSTIHDENDLSEESVEREVWTGESSGFEEFTIQTEAGGDRNQKYRLPGTKRSLEISCQVSALSKGAEALEKMAEADERSACSLQKRCWSFIGRDS